MISRRLRHGEIGVESDLLALTPRPGAWMVRLGERGSGRTTALKLLGQRQSESIAIYLDARDYSELPTDVSVFEHVPEQLYGAAWEAEGLCSQRIFCQRRSIYSYIGLCQRLSSEPFRARGIEPARTVLPMSTPQAMHTSSASDGA